MKQVDSFTPEVAEFLGNYVYRLIDPRNGETFYVGKGKGNRLFSHVGKNWKDLMKPAPTDDQASEDEAPDDEKSLKIARIDEIKNAHLEVQYVIHRHKIPDTAVFEVEAAVIDSYPGLANIQGGHGSGARGPMSVTQIIATYELPKLEENPREKLLLININNLRNASDREEIYRQTRFAWRISSERAQKADYVLAVVRGVVVGVFVVDEWLAATHANFPEHISVDEEMPTRSGFIGRPAAEDIWTRFAGEQGKRIVSDKMTHVRNPIRYYNL